MPTPSLGKHRRKAGWCRISLPVLFLMATAAAIVIFYAVIFNALRKVNNTNVTTPLKPNDERNPALRNTLQTEEKFHVIFSTDCSGYQRWQSYLFFHNAMKIKQPGIVTRIASGCSDEEAKFENEWHNLYIRPMSSKFLLHLTPDFTAVTNAEGKKTASYEYFNKPFGLKHWLENSNHGFMRIKDPKYNHQLDDTFVILLDPDMVLVRPITNDFSDHPVHSSTVLNQASIGKPYAQEYGFGNQWMKLDLALVTGDPNTPAKMVSMEEGLKHFPVGPPYIAALPDMYNIALHWSLFVPEVHKQYPHLLAEMFAFCIAAAHLQLPHTLMSSSMVSNTLMATSEEGWSPIDQVEYTKQCAYANTIQSTILPAEQRKRNTQSDTTPNVIHYCQRYGIGPWFFGKRRVPNYFFKDSSYCNTPLLISPHEDLTKTEYDYWIPPPPSKGQKPEARRMVSDPIRRKREAFTLCFLIQAMNDASKFFKMNHCTNANFTEGMNLFYE